MCLSIPMRVVSIDARAARCEAKGIAREVSLLLLADEDVAPGDHVLVHLGHAIRKVSAAEAMETWALFDELLAAADCATGRPSA